MIRKITVGAIAFLALGMFGNMDYADALNTEADEKLARPLRAALLEPSAVAATIAECDRAEPGTVLTFNTTRDGIPWWHRRICFYPA